MEETAEAGAVLVERQQACDCCLRAGRGSL
jgi:hypothetical protein